jgi:hypothetical protein
LRFWNRSRQLLHWRSINPPQVESKSSNVQDTLACWFSGRVVDEVAPLSFTLKEPRVFNDCRVNQERDELAQLSIFQTSARNFMEDNLVVLKKNNTPEAGKRYQFAN